MKRRPILTRLWRIIRMTLGLLFGRRAVWVVVEGDDCVDALENARLICPCPDQLQSLCVEPLPGLPNLYRVHYLYRGEK